MWDFICGCAVGVFNAVTGALQVVGETILRGIQAIFSGPSANNIVKNDAANKKDKIIRSDEKVIGLQNPSIVHTSSPGTLTTTLFDTTTYPDRARIVLTNATGSSTTCAGIAIHGQLVVEHAGSQGYIWEYSDYDSIDKNGEQFYELSNDYIISGSQAEYIGDYLWKELKAHSMYQLILHGTQFQYDIGDVWHLTISYTINGMPSEAENIDTDVEIVDIAIRRNHDTIGETLLTVRVPSGSWTKTLSRRAKLVTSGTPQRLYNRSNILTIASSTWTGQADYFCDGTNDDVEIQAAIDYLSLIGGGEIILTSGIFYLSNVVHLCSNLIVSGNGYQTIINKISGTIGAFTSMDIYYTPHDNIVIRDMTFDYENRVATTYTNYELGALNLVETNFSVNPETANKVYNCSIKNMALQAPYGAVICGIQYARGGVFGCNISNITVDGVSSPWGHARGIMSCWKVTNCIVNGIYATQASDLAYGYWNNRSCQQNSAQNCTTSGYTLSYADAGTSNPCADTAAGGYNS